MSRTPASQVSPFGVPAKPTEITLDTLPQLFAHNRALFGGWSMEDAPQRPEDVPQETWDALGDPGKAALTAERSARQAAEQARDTAVRERDAARARPAPPRNDPPSPPAPPTPPAPPAGGGGQPDLAALVTQAVQAAMAPITERETQREAQSAAQKVADAVVEAAKPLLHDPTDALGNVDLTTVVTEAGLVDPEKVKTALEAVVTAKPHLAKSTNRLAPFGIGGGAPVATPDGDRVKSILAEMQSSTGVRSAAGGS